MHSTRTAKDFPKQIIMNFILGYYNCQACLMTFKNKEERLRHLLSDCPGCYCPNCRKFYKRKASLVNHLRDECGKEEKYFCDLCPYKSKIKYNYVRHKRKHTE